MTRRDLEATLRALAVVASREERAARARGHRPVGTCIGTTRLAVNALRELGVRAEPVPVAVLVTNDPYRRAEAEGAFDSGDKARLARAKWEKAYSVWIGRDMSGRDPASFFARDVRDDNGWDGHLLMVVERSWLADLTIIQARRESLHVPDAIVAQGRGRDLLEGREVIVPMDDEFGTEVAYVATEDRHYLTAPDWTKLSPRCNESRRWGRMLREQMAHVVC